MQIDFKNQNLKTDERYGILQNGPFVYYIKMERSGTHQKGSTRFECQEINLLTFKTRTIEKYCYEFPD